MHYEFNLVSSARWDLCGGPPARAVPTAICGYGRESVLRLGILGSGVEGGGAPYGPEMGPAVCGALAESPDADAGRNPHRTDPGDATGWPDFTVARQLVPALRL